MPTPRVSFEFFPPKSLEASFRLWDTIHTLAPLDPPLSKASAEVIELGRTKYARYCAVCHAPGAVGSTELPDLRRSGALENRTAWLQIVHGGALSDNGMASFVVCSETLFLVSHHHRATL